MAWCCHMNERKRTLSGYVCVAVRRWMGNLSRTGVVPGVGVGVCTKREIFCFQLDPAVKGKIWS
jgi:hypothetical protein